MAHKWKGGKFFTFTMIGYYSGGFKMVGDRLKVIILYQFRKMTSFFYDYERNLQEIT